MARRGRSRKDRPRTPTGQPSRAGRSATDTAINALLLAHRLDPIDAEAADKIRDAQLQLDRLPAGYPRTPQEAARQRECMDTVHTSGAAAKNPNLSFPLGIAFERGLIGEPEFKAGELFARLHSAVWRKIHRDIETALGPDDFNLLLETGRVGSPVPPSSFFRKLVAGDPSPVSDLDPEEYQRRRERIADRLGQARSALLRMGLTHGHPLGSILRTEKILTEDFMPGFLGPHGARTATDQVDQATFCDALKALAELFGYDKSERRHAPPLAPPGPAAEPAEQTQHVSAADVLAAAERRSERRGKGLDVVFSPDIDGRTDTGTVNQSVDKFVRRTKLPPPWPYRTQCLVDRPGKSGSL